MQTVEILQQRGYNFLWIDGELWMWDIPEEVAGQQYVADKAYGNVLVAGYGLGVIQRCLKANPFVSSIVSVERNLDVLKECHRVYGELTGEVIHGDFLDYESDVKYDCVIRDIWLEYGTERDVESYKKFKERAKCFVKKGGPVLGWGQDFLEYLIEKEIKV